MRVTDYRRTHSAPVFDAGRLRELTRGGGDLSPENLRALAEELGMPPAALRGVLTSYADLHEAEAAHTVCRGTSCSLCTRADAKTDPGSREAYCLGYCDRSPVVLEHGVGVFGPGEEEPLSALPDLRCLASEPIILRRLLRGDMRSLKAARNEGAYGGLRAAIEGGGEAVLHAVEESHLRGRGGAGFPAGRKWRECAKAAGPVKYVVANGDEGDPGSFVDRVLMECDPHGVIEGMILCGLAVGAQHGVVFIRSEYPAAISVMKKAIAEAEGENLLGEDILGTGYTFHLSVFEGMGSYVCGEETAMLNAMEGVRGEVRLRPPFPAHAGYLGCPTVVNNVETLANVPWIMERGAEAFLQLGNQDSTGTMAMCLNAGFARPGIVEVEFGISLLDVIKEAGGSDGLDAIMLGGPMGSIIFHDDWDIPICFSAMARCGYQLGHGGMVAIPTGADYHALLMHLAKFMMDESCGKCVPCRLGSRAIFECLGGDGHSRAKIMRLLHVAEEASLCAFGQLMPGPMRQILEKRGDGILAGGRHS